MENSMPNNTPNNTPKPLNRLNKTLVERPYNPLYDGRSSEDNDLKFNQLYLIPIMCLLGFWYIKTQDKDAEIQKARALTPQEKITNNRLLFDEDGNEIAEIGTKSDPHNYVDSVYLPTVYDTKTVRERGVYAQNNGDNNDKRSRNKPPKRTLLTDLDGLKNSLVFAGSFVNQENADRLVTHLKTIGYDKAEIVMKENLPYKVVVTGFYNHEKSAKKEVNALEKRGMEGYSTSNNLDEIYRKKSN
jgi:hypothetical protein